MSKEIIYKCDICKNTSNKSEHPYWWYTEDSHHSDIFKIIKVFSEDRVRLFVEVVPDNGIHATYCDVCFGNLKKKVEKALDSLDNLWGKKVKWIYD